ncbi:MAG: hypothetical protein R3250_15030, partial [Melioribacteraceae bacterium]|nr:hypothetical protein [Melioribacteraceae bacterium]
VGSVLVPENDKLKFLSLNSNSDDFSQTLESFNKDSLLFGSSSRVLLGNYKNVSSDALLAFIIFLPDSIQSPLESSDSVTLKSAWVEIYPDYWLGDESDFNFSVRRINTTWNPITMDQDTFNVIKNTLGPNTLTKLEFTPGDTLLRFEFDNSIVEDWVYESFDESYPPNYGIMLSPLSSNGIMGFQGISAFQSSPYPILNLEFEKEGDFIDTVLAVPNLDIHLPTGEPLQDPVNELILQGSIGVRGKLKFNFENVPERILVNSAILKLFFNPVNSFQGSVPTDTIAVSMLQNFSDDDIRLEFGRYPLLQKEDFYEGEIRQFIQRWIDGEPNEGMEIKLSDEARSASAISFYSSSHPVDSLRPNLTIYYTTR